MIQKHLLRNGNTIDDHIVYLLHLIDITKIQLDNTFMTEATEAFIERMRQQTIESQKYTQEQVLRE